MIQNNLDYVALYHKIWNKIPRFIHPNYSEIYKIQTKNVANMNWVSEENQSTNKSLKSNELLVDKGTYIITF